MLPRLSLSLGSVAQSRLLRDTTLVFISNFGSALTLFISSVILARIWGIASFGSITSLLGIASLAVGITDLGISLSAIRLVSQYQSRDPERYHFLLLSILAVEVALGSLLVLIALIGAPWVAAQVLHAPAEAGAVRWILLGAACLSATSYATVTLQAHRRFGLAAFVAILGTALRTAGTIAASLWSDRIENVALAYCLATFCTMLVGFTIVLRRFPPFAGMRVPAKRRTARLFFDFAKWVAVTATLSALLMRTDVILLTTLSTAVQVGLYGVAFQLSIGALIAINSFNTVLLPRASRIHTRADLIRYAQQSLALATAVGSGIILLWLAAGPLVALLYGNSFLDAVPVLRMMLIGYLLYAFTYPFVLLTYRLDRPDIPSKINVANLFLLVLGDIVLIPYLGAAAPAVMLGVCTLFGQSIILFWLVTHGRTRALQLGLVLRDA